MAHHTPDFESEEIFPSSPPVFSSSSPGNPSFQQLSATSDDPNLLSSPSPRPGQLQSTSTYLQPQQNPESSNAPLFAAASTASSITSSLSSAPSYLLTPSLRTMRTSPVGPRTSLSSPGLSPRTTETLPSRPGESSRDTTTSIPAIYLQAKKSRKSFIWEPANGEEYMLQGKWRWRCARCMISLLTLTTH